MKVISNYIPIVVTLWLLSGFSSQVGIGYDVVSEFNLTSLSETFKDDFEIGTAISTEKLNDKITLKIVEKHFSSITAENEMKPVNLLRKNGDYNWRPGNRLVAFAQKNNLNLRGHTLLWHKQTPDWFFKDAQGKLLNKAQLYIKQYSYMKSVMGHFDKVMVWDVVNEAVNDQSNTEFIYRRKGSRWFEICGSEYIAKAFEMAHAIAPKKKLFYNDYGLLSSSKQKKVFRLLKGLIDHGVPVHGIGIQAHWSIYDHPQDVEKLISRFASLGLEIHITELDVSVFRGGDKAKHRNYIFSEEDQKRQVAFYQSIFKIFRKYKNEISSVSFWGVRDNESWLNKHPVKGRRNYPLLFDDQGMPKKSFYAISNFSK
ncbi:MAG: endo-1,4-beta-xylanase [Flavobacteriaceae bacterium]|jgi:endo-1,4-beta-xylanase